MFACHQDNLKSWLLKIWTYNYMYYGGYKNLKFLEKQ